MENYWLKKLEEIQEPEWPYTLDAAATTEATVPIDDHTLDALNAIAGNDELNLLKLLAGGLGVVLSRYTARQRLAIALPPLDLPDTDAEASGTLYCLLDIDPALPAHALLDQVHESLSEAYQYSEYSDEELDKLFAAQHIAGPQARSIGLECTGATLEGRWLQDHPLVFSFSAAARRLRVRSRALPLPADMLQSMAESLLLVASGFAVNKDRPLEQLPLVPPAKLNAWLAGFDGRRRDYRVGITVIDLFEEAARRNPEGIALVYGAETVSYAALDEWSARIARYLLPYSTGEQLFIGVMMERSPALVAAVLGILRAGAAYVPIDPSYPQERIREIMADTGSPLVLTDAAAGEGGATYAFADISSLTDTGDAPLPRTSPEGVAYVIYSSGTTGKPKGIMIQHKAIMNLLWWYNERYGIGADTRIVQLTNIVIDIAFQEIFSALMNGLTLYLPQQEEQQDKQLFIRFLERHRISFIQLIPDVLSAYFLDVPRVESLEVVLCGGDKLSEPLKDRILEKDYRLFNIYGQTETAIDTVGAECRPEEPMRFDDYVPNYHVLILDDQLQPCPEYIAGEICTGGDGLALGYLGNAAATAAKFIDHPFRKGERLYRTGDRARRLPDGSLRLLGREDQQVKIRGYRIELEEVEGVLHRYPGIEAAAVIAQETAGDKQLVAFIAATEPVDLQQCMEYVKEQLPAYMVPSLFVAIDRLPLTPTGKVDRRALARYEGPALSSGETYVAPRNEVEEELVRIWEDLLGRSGIGVKDDFFNLGGHSLKVTRLVSRIRKAMDVVIGLKDIFLHPVLEAQAALILAAKKESHVSIPKVAESESYELSSAQGRLWLLCQFEGSNAAYNIPGVTRFHGPLDPDALDRAFDQLLERHQSLRTVFRSDENGQPRQLILSPEALGFRLTRIDLRDIDDQQAVLHEQLAHDFRQPFDLGHGPLLRAALYRLEDEVWVFSYVLHHIISDAWSMAVFFRDLLKAYEASLEGKTGALTPLPLHYRDYAAWQRAQLTGNGHRSYWLEQLGGELPVLQLPLDKPRPAIKTYEGGLVRHRFSSELTQNLQALLRRKGCTLFMGVVAGVNALLYKYSGQDDMIVGSPVAGREHSDLEEQIGFYVNTLALRTRLSGSEGFEALLAGVRQTTLKAYEHQSYPFDELVSALSVPHDPGRSALFDVMVALQNAGDDELDTTALPGGLRLERSGPVAHVSSKFDLLFNFHESEGSLQLSIEYNSDLFERGRVERMGEHMEGLLQAAVEKAETPLEDLDYMSEAEREQLLDGFNATADAGYPTHKTIVTLFEEQVEKTPDRIALVSGERRISYRALNTTANRLARYLRERQSVAPQELVGILLERSEWMVISILAILKAGGAYVPIDPHYPQDRIDYMTEDSGCRILIDDEELARFNDSAQDFSDANPERINRPSDLAYVIYTSGTTGKPKGSLIEHRNVVRLMVNDAPLFDFNERDVWTMFHSYCFDFSVWEMYGALLFGGCVVVVPLMIARDPSAFLGLLHREGVTVLNQTPSSFYNLIKTDEEGSEGALALRYVIFGGEALSPGRLRGWHERYPQTKLINMYGITETTVHVTFKEIGETEIAGNISNIGRAIPTLRTYVLDARRHLLPIGVWGELYVGGAGVARGYLNREELTRERFIASPFREGERLYRSGDRVRVLANGEMEYDGRLDEQVKIRGHRIELGEIELSLERHEDVQRAVVVARTGANGAKELVAYLLCTAPLNLATLRTWLNRHLPDYMIPAYFVALDQMPLTSNGKIDRKRLPEPDISAQLGAGTAVPQTEMQKILVAVWQQVLGLDGIGIHDNFFSIGGNSITMIELISAARKRSVAITIRQIFENPTVATLAEVAARSGQGTIEQGPVAGSMPLLPVQRWYFEHQQEGAHHFNYAIILPVAASLDRAALDAIATALVKKHDALRLRFPEAYDGTASYQPLSPSMIGAMTGLEDYGHLNDEERLVAVGGHAAAVQQSLNLHEGPLCRLIQYKYGNDEGRLLLVVHHLVVDGVSWRILVADLNALLQQQQAQKTLDAGAKTSSYKSWAERLERHAGSAQVQAERTYWHSVLEGSPAFPIDAPKADRRTGEQQHLLVELDEDATANLLSASLRAYNTQTRELLLTALLLAVCRWGGVDGLLLHQEGHGREAIFDDMDLSQTVGWFTSIYPVRLHKGKTDLSTGRGIGSAIKYVKETLRSVPGNGIGYGLLRYGAGDETLAALEARNPAALLFNYLGDFTQAQNNAGATHVQERFGETISPRQRALYPLEFNGAVFNRRLRFRISYVPGEYRTATVEILAGIFKEALLEVADHCLHVEKPHFTPSDFPLAGLGQARIEELEEEFPALEELYPATPMQKAMFFHSLVSEGEGAYIVQQHGHLKNIDPDIFARAWQQLVARHSILRTAFVLCEVNGLLQVVSNTAEVSSTFIDCCRMSERAWTEKIAACVEEDALLDFDFERAPLLRYTLLQRDERSYYVLLSMHHIILDGWSMPVLFSELGTIYRQLHNGEGVQLPPVPPYGKYVHWLLTQNLAQANRFWQNRFGHADEITHLASLDEAAATVPVTGHKELMTELTDDEYELLKATAASHQVTLHTLMVAAWARVLTEYTASEDVVFGMTVSGRSEAFEGVQNMVGLFINSIPVKVSSVSGEPLPDWLSTIHKEQLDYNQYGLLGLADIRRLSGLDPDTQLFESLLVHQNYPLQLGGKSSDDGDALFEFSNAGFRDENNAPLTVMVFSRRQLSFLMIYRTEIFSDDFVRRLSASFRRQLMALTQEGVPSRQDRESAVTL